MRKEIPGQPLGTVYSFTQVSRDAAPSTHEEFAPYVVALVDVTLGNGQARRMTVRMTQLDPDHEIKIGDPVELVTGVLRRYGERGLIIYGYAARSSLAWDKAELIEEERSGGAGARRLS